MDVHNIPFPYSPLGNGEIRLLYLYWVANEIIGFLKTVKLDQVDFDALSYAWGNSSQTHSFNCNNHVLQIHHNLHEALPYLAHRQSTLPIWIDAVCINQANHAEKFSQIRLMQKIYQQAELVWVWLDPPTLEANSGHAIELLPHIACLEKLFINIPKQRVRCPGGPLDYLI
jgi:hypothetical protein